MERAKLAPAGLAKLLPADTSNHTLPERLRMAFEELGPTFIKFGQLLATRPDLIPGDIAEEFKKLHDQVKPLEFSEIEAVLVQHLGKNFRDHFENIETSPVGCASIAQVHMARLKSGEKVVIKVQRPGIEKLIGEDLSVLYTMAELAENYLPELKLYNPLMIVDEFAKNLDLETNYIIEANNIRRFQENFANEENIKIPSVYQELSGRRVLVMEALEGIPLSQKSSLTQEGIDPEAVLKLGLHAYLKMVFSDGLFHGDLHAGNMFVLPNNRIGLIDFGVVGRLNKKTQAAIANMLIALADEDYDRLAYEYLDLSPYSEGVNADHFARDLRDLIAPYYGVTLKNVNVGRLLMDSAGIAVKYRLKPPSELMVFFKSIVTIEGMGRAISKDFNFLAYSQEFAAEVIKMRSEPVRLLRELTGVGRDVNSLLTDFPRQMRQILRRMLSPDFAIKVEMSELENIRDVTKKSANLVFLGLVIAALLIGAAMLAQINHGPYFLGLPMMSFLHYMAAGILGVVAFVNYIKH